MIEFAAEYFDGKRTESHAVTVTLHNREISVQGDDIVKNEEVSKVRITPRVANTRRYIYFEDNSCIAADNNDEIDEWLSLYSYQPFWNVINKLEKSWTASFIAASLVIFISWFTLRVAIPSVAKPLALVFPEAISKRLTDETIKQLDSSVLIKKTKLKGYQRRHYLKMFKDMTKPIKGFNFKIHFRSAPLIGPNAFALPTGDIFVLDELVHIAKHPDEVRAVLAHEIGHVVGRHSIIMLIQDSSWKVILLMFTDVSLGGSALSLATVLLESSYSRELERQADIYAFNYLKSNNYPLTRFSDIMQTMARGHKKRKLKKKGKKKRRKKRKSKGPKILDYLSSHPATEKRIKMFEDGAKLQLKALLKKRLAKNKKRKRGRKRRRK